MIERCISKGWVVEIKAKCIKMRDSTEGTSKTEHMPRWTQEEYLVSHSSSLLYSLVLVYFVIAAVTWWWKIVTGWEKTMMQHLYYTDIILSLISHTWISSCPKARSVAEQSVLKTSGGGAGISVFKGLRSGSLVEKGY